MLKIFLRKLKKKFGRRYNDINPEDIFLDATNLPGFAEHKLEGRIEKPMGEKTFLFVRIFFTLVVVLLISRLWTLGIYKGAVYAEISENNRLEHTLIFANRGVIYDRNLVELAGNEVREDADSFAGRIYREVPGLSHVVGYLKYPATDSKGFYYDVSYRGRDGAERVFDEILSGENGLKLRETDVSGHITSESVIDEPVDGEPVILSVDAPLTEVLHDAIRSLAFQAGFEGGAGVVMDVRTGEILALTSYPEYDQNVITRSSDRTAISRMLNDPKRPFLNRAIGGLYTPGSILKPIVALAALNEGIISPEKKILSTGSITVPNPYDPSKPSIFRDWKAHGWTNMAEAIAVSSDVYFYSIGGGYRDQKGLGISLLDKYLNMFEVADKTGIELLGEVSGVVPTPEWKAEKFDGDIWRLGDTYITAIGQYGTLVTPISAARFTSAIANGGNLLKPSIKKGGVEEPLERNVGFKSSDWSVVRQGMRSAVTIGTAGAINVPYVKAAAKTGTAEVGSLKRYVNSWSIGFFPYESPKYAFAIIMEKGPSTNAIGATSVMRKAFDWMNLERPEYFLVD